MVVVAGGGDVFMDGKRIGTARSVTIERNLNEPTRGFVTSWEGPTFVLEGEAAERALRAIWPPDEWRRLNKLRMLMQEARMREFARRKGRKK